MARGISVHVGVNKPDAVFGVHELQGCIKDAEAMFDVATTNNFEAKILRNDEAKFENVESLILQAASELKAGDIFLFTFAGHGSFKSTQALPEGDFQDETILLHDCLLIDNYLHHNFWSQFQNGVRILGLADSCHSGTVLTSSILTSLPSPEVVTEAATINVLAVNAAVAGPLTESKTTLRQIPHTRLAKYVNPWKRKRNDAIRMSNRTRGFTDKQRDNIIAARPTIHEKLRTGLFTGEKGKVKADILTLAACRDSEEALDGFDHGAFTQALIDVWDSGSFAGSYHDFIGKIKAKFVGSQQHPILQPDDVNQEFLGQRPFTI